MTARRSCSCRASATSGGGVCFQTVKNRRSECNYDADVRFISPRCSAARISRRRSRRRATAAHVVLHHQRRLGKGADLASPAPTASARRWPPPRIDQDVPRLARRPRTARPRSTRDRIGAGRGSTPGVSRRTSPNSAGDTLEQARRGNNIQKPTALTEKREVVNEWRHAEPARHDHRSRCSTAPRSSMARIIRAATTR